jgi:hypothetical protein
MQENLGLKRKARAVIAALLILAATALAMPSTASAAHGRGWGGYRVARHSYGRVAYRPHYRSFYGYRPYYVSYYRPRYRTVVFDDPYCDDDPYYVVRPVYRTYYHHRPRVGVSLVFGNGGGYGYYGDPYCGW